MRTAHGMSLGKKSRYLLLIAAVAFTVPACQSGRENEFPPAGWAGAIEKEEASLRTNNYGLITTKQTNNEHGE